MIHRKFYRHNYKARRNNILSKAKILKQHIAKVGSRISKMITEDVFKYLTRKFLSRLCLLRKSNKKYDNLESLKIFLVQVGMVLDYDLRDYEFKPWEELNTNS